MDIKTLLKSSVAAGALVALAAPMQTAEAGGISNGNSKMDLKVGGRVVRGLAYADDGDNSALFHTAGRSADTEFYFSASGKLTESVSVGALHRIDVNETGNDFRFDDRETTTSTGADAVKYSKVHFAHKSLGTLHVGHWEQAGDGANNLKYGGAIVGSPGLLQGTIVHRAAGAATSVVAGSQVSNLDQGRGNLVRYDSPSFSGFTVSAHTGDDGDWGTAVRYSGKLAGLSVKAAYAFNSDTANVANNKTWGGSIAVMHSSGLHVNFGKASRRGNDTGLKPEFMRIAGGYEAKLNSMGKTNFYVQWFDGDDVATAGRSSTQLNVGVHQGLDSIGGTIGLVYSTTETDDLTANNYEDVDVIYMETVVNF